jgi:alpha-L-arabinofuranosidase
MLHAALNIRKPLLTGVYMLLSAAMVAAQTSGPVSIEIKADQVIAPVSPQLYGLMTEEINHSYDGGLYAELVRNRNFKEDAKDPVYWDLVQEGDGKGSMALDPSTPLNDAIPASLKLVITNASARSEVGVGNQGFWGISAKANTPYHATIYAKADRFAGSLTIAIVNRASGAAVATATIPKITTTWQKYEVTLTTGNSVPTGANRIVVSANRPGTIWLGMVSLFPPTFANRANGNRQDIMQLLADMKPAFLRFPGGNYLEGNTVSTRFDWKRTIGDISQRPGHMDDAWRYWSSDGMGLLEFLEWCEDLHMQPVLAVYAGYSLSNGANFAPGPDLEPFVNDALDEIQYVTGDASTKWGAERAKDGHPAPFPLEYVEIGNEDGFDPKPGGYERRFGQFFDAIRSQYPQLKIIATAPVATRQADVIDEHYYRRPAEDMAAHANDYDTRRRGAQKVFVGEWATRVGEPTPNWDAGLADAAWLTGLERNSDLVIMASYAPLFVNVSQGAAQWPTDLIGYDAYSSYGSPTYYVQKLFSTNHGDEILPIAVRNVPSQEWQPPASLVRGATVVREPMPEQVPLMFFDATRDSKTGTVYIKIVSRAETPEPVHIAIGGAASIDSQGKTLTMSASSRSDTNSIAEPAKIVPVSANIDGLSGDFAKTVPPYSVTVLELRTK